MRTSWSDRKLTAITSSSADGWMTFKCYYFFVLMLPRPPNGMVSNDIFLNIPCQKSDNSSLPRSCSRLQEFSCRRDHDADADAIMKFFTWSKTEKLREWPHDRTQFPADGIRMFRLLYIRSLVHDVIKIEVHDRVCVCAPSVGNIDTPY